MAKEKLAFILGIRPDVIRASLIINLLKKENSFDTVFIWSGQHYSDNLKDIFFRELKVVKPDIELGCEGSNDAEIVSSIIAKLYPVLEEMKPKAVVYLGDTNTVASCLAAAQLNIPIIHIEGCMRSYDWRMPEEKYRSTIDHLSDLIYTYFDEYKEQGVREGLNPENIVVVGNPIVDILNNFYFKRLDYFQSLANEEFFAEHQVKKQQYFLMTCHRRENVHNSSSFQAILDVVAAAPYPVYFPASYRTQQVIKESGVSLPENLILVDPIGYQEFVLLMVNSRGVLTDSGTVVEEASVLGVPSLQMRRATERPQVYDVQSSVKFDPTQAAQYPTALLYQKLEKLFHQKWQHNLGDGKTSARIAEDLIARMKSGQMNGHRPENYHLPISRSYREDDIKL
jgi:UDP-N-acetylglucosamine 2-epimerase (non-hydrolysing)